MAFPDKHWLTDGKFPDFFDIGFRVFAEKEDWTTTIEGQALRDTFLSLSKMTPEVYNEWWSPTTACLTHSVHTDVWLAANSLLGSTWSLQT